MATYIPKDFSLSNHTRGVLNRRGVTDEFIGHEIDAFLIYWNEKKERKLTGGQKESWQMTCLNWMKRTYEDKKHRMAQNRTYAGQQGNVFAKVLDNLEQGAMHKAMETSTTLIAKGRIHPPEYVRPEIEVDPNKTTEDYLDELRRMAR